MLARFRPPRALWYPLKILMAGKNCEENYLKNWKNCFSSKITKNCPPFLSSNLFTLKSSSRHWISCSTEAPSSVFSNFWSQFEQVARFCSCWLPFFSNGTSPEQAGHRRDRIAQSWQRNRHEWNWLLGSHFPPQKNFWCNFYWNGKKCATHPPQYYYNRFWLYLNS